ncbi:MAG: hypothetical protein ACI4RS_05875 [Monoglobaceae bacterium]
MTKMFEEIQKLLNAISDNAKITDNLTKALQRLIRTTKLNNLGIYSKDKTPEFEHRITGIKDFSPSDIYHLFTILHRDLFTESFPLVAFS